MHRVRVYVRNALKELGLIFVISFLMNTLLIGRTSFNCIVLYTKQYIFFCLKQNRVPVFCGLYNYLQLRYKVEKSAYLDKLENEKKNKTWSTWSGYFTSGSSIIDNDIIS